MDRLGFLTLLVTCGFVISQYQPTTPGPPTVSEIICNWASCLGLCPSSGVTRDPQVEALETCSELLPDSAKVSSCRPYEYCVSMNGTLLSGKRCKPGSKYETVCFQRYYDETISGNNTVLCLDKDLSSCVGLTEYCHDNRQECSNTIRERTSQPPSTIAVPTEATEPAETTIRVGAGSKHPTTMVTTPHASTSHVMTNRGTTPQSEASIFEFLTSNPFFIGLAVGFLIITPCLLCMLVYCLNRRKRSEVSQKNEGYEMNDAVYQAVGPELPPNHPSTKIARSPSTLTAVSGVSYQELDAESRFTTEDCNSHQSLQMSRTSLDHRSELGPVRYDTSLPSKYRKSTKRTNSFAMINREAYRNERLARSMYNSDSCILKSSGNNREYATLEPGNRGSCREGNRMEPRKTRGERSDVDRPLMALNLAGMEAGKGTQEMRNQDDRGTNSDFLSDSRDNPPGAGYQELTTESMQTDNCLTKLSEPSPVLDMSEPSKYSGGNGQKSPTDEMGYTAGEEESKSSQIVEGSDNPPRRLMTFPRRKGHSTNELDRREDDENGSETPSRSKFRSLRFVNRKSRRAKKWKKASDGELCLDLKISSPTTPEEPVGQCFFTAAVPIVPIVPIENKLETTEADEIEPPQEVSNSATLPETTEPMTVPSITGVDPGKLHLPLSSNSPDEDVDTNKLHPLLESSQSQEFLSDDVVDEPFRSRSCSQPIRKTFSPSLSKEYKEIRESWGATYLQNYNIEEES